MNTIELFCGTKSFSKVAKKLGHNTFTVDNNKDFNPDLVLDLLSLYNDDLLKKLSEADVVWMSPPCTTFSLASGNTHWTVDRKPKTEAAKIGLHLLKKCELIAEYCIIRNKIFFIENPNGRAVWFLPDKWLKRVWYCQYGDSRAKPTNIWTNLDIEFKTCKNNNPDCNHIRAKRGSKMGTQGEKSKEIRGKVPPLLIKEILEFLQIKQRENDKE